MCTSEYNFEIQQLCKQILFSPLNTAANDYCKRKTTTWNYIHLLHYTGWSTNMVVISLCSGQSSPFPVPHCDAAGLHWPTVPARLHTWPGHQHHPLPLHLFTAALCWYTSSRVVNIIHSLCVCSQLHFAYSPV